MFRPQSFIIFRLSAPLKHLLCYGYVYTVRKRRKSGLAKLYDADKTLLGIVEIEEIGRIVQRQGELYVDQHGEIIPLFCYAKESGFKDYLFWKYQIKKIYGVISGLYLYYVRLLR